MDLRLYDTLTREKRTFVPLDPDNVRMYVCGPTVYDFAHIGNARPVIVFDVLFRLLRHIYGEKHVTYVRNITDVDDKINARALRDFPGLPLNDAIHKVTEVTESQFQADVLALGCLTPTYQPRATDFVLPRDDERADMKSLVQKLLDRENAYLAIGSEGKEVLFDVSSMPDYGALSKRKLDQQMPGARIAVDAHKKNPEDFVLWKESGSKEPGWKGEFTPNPKSGYYAEFTVPPENARELQLNSRVVAIHGRPGWHIECSAMSAAYLGDVFDIHGGGLDLIFPHHENEIAQSRCAHGTPTMANYWMHNGFLEVEGAKMSKSTGNFLTIRDVLGSWTGAVIRYAMLQTHYHQPINWTVSRLEDARREIGGWAAMYSGSEAHHDYQQRKFKKIEAQPTQELVDALGDDLNTWNAITVLRKQFSEKSSTEGLTKEFFQNCEFLGLLNGEDVGALEDTHVSGSNVKPGLLFDAIPSVMKLRVGIANRLPEVVLQAERDLGAIGVKAEIRRDAFVEITPLEKSGELDTEKINSLISDRTVARARKDFKESDRIRDELAAMGVVIKDSKEGTTWEIAR
jgi:cysteinyl-tRNA synthetase